MVLIQCTLWLLYFFFFQAEDGIRDFHVTGVQTCALPILLRNDWPCTAPGDGAGRHRSRVRLVFRKPPVGEFSGRGSSGNARRPVLRTSVRSEERRVGKEWRSRGSAGA